MPKLSLQSVQANLNETNSKLDLLLSKISGIPASPPANPTPLQLKLAEMERVQSELAAMQNIAPSPNGHSPANPNEKWLAALPPAKEKEEWQPKIVMGSDWVDGSGKTVKGQPMLIVGYVKGKVLQFGVGKAKMLQAVVDSGLLAEFIRRCDVVAAK